MEKIRFEPLVISCWPACFGFRYLDFAFPCYRVIAGGRGPIATTGSPGKIQKNLPFGTTGNRQVISAALSDNDKGA